MVDNHDLPPSVLWWITEQILGLKIFVYGDIV